MKRCSSCRQSKPPGEFQRDKRYRDGLTGRCTACIVAYNRERRREKRRYKAAKRTCLRCRKRKTPGSFHVHSRRADGRTQLCKACLAELTAGAPGERRRREAA